MSIGFQKIVKKIVLRGFIGRINIEIAQNLIFVNGFVRINSSN
jgi:hypothetical protein